MGALILTWCGIGYILSSDDVDDVLTIWPTQLSKLNILWNTFNPYSSKHPRLLMKITTCPLMASLGLPALIPTKRYGPSINAYIPLLFALPWFTDRSTTIVLRANRIHRRYIHVLS